MSFEYWYVFPVAVLVAMTANASGFSGPVLFQPFFYFVIKLPVAQSIATGIATETLGMTSGSLRYYQQKAHDRTQLRKLLGCCIVGVVMGYYVFLKLSPDVLRLIVGLVVLGIAAYQLRNALGRHLGDQETLPPNFKRKYGALFGLAGAFSACTGTGVAEISQTTLEHHGKLRTHRANATAILLEAISDWVISFFNISTQQINWSVLVFSGAGVLMGAQIGAHYSRYLPARLLKIVFSLSLMGVGGFYVFRFIRS